MPEVSQMSFGALHPNGGAGAGPTRGINLAWRPSSATIGAC